MRLIGQPKMYLVKVMENGVIINAFELPAFNYNNVHSQSKAMVEKIYGYYQDEYELIIKQL